MDKTGLSDIIDELQAKLENQSMSLGSLQTRVNEWITTAFGREAAKDKAERNHRFLEEALELVQANGCTKREAYQLVDYVFNRPAGDPAREVGGVMNTLAALANASDIDISRETEKEMAIVWKNIDKIREKRLTKPTTSPLPSKRAEFRIVSATGDTVCIIDLDGPVSITNDAEDVVQRVLTVLPRSRIIYRDTNGNWDELLHKDGEFTGFGTYEGSPK